MGSYDASCMSIFVVALCVCVSPFVCLFVFASTNLFVCHICLSWPAQILPYVNGFNHLARIAWLADVDLALVTDCIRHLIMLGVVAVIPVFQYSNIYRPTPKLAQLAKCKEMQERCIEQCTKINAYKNMPGPKAKIRDIFRFFSNCAHGATFSELCVRFNPAALNINERQLVLFGLLEGLIKKIDKYPITVQRNVFYDHEPIRSPIVGTSSNSHNNNSGSQPLPRDRRDGRSHQNATNETPSTSNKNPSSERVQNAKQQQQQHYYYYNGLKSYDEICTERGISGQKLDYELSKDRHVIVLLR